MVKIALLIGVSEYEPGLTPLPAAAKDVEAMQRVLLHPEIGGFDDVTLLLNPQQHQMAVAIETLFDGRQRDDLVLLFFLVMVLKTRAESFTLLLATLPKQTKEYY